MLWLRQKGWCVSPEAPAVSSLSCRQGCACWGRFCCHSLSAAAGQPAAWTFPLSILGMVDVHVWGMGSWKQVLRWNLLKVLRWVRSSQCHIHLVAHRCGVTSDWLKTSYYIMKRQCSVISVGQRKDLWRYIKKQLWSWEASDERLLCKFLINPWPLSHLAELFIN